MFAVLQSSSATSSVSVGDISVDTSPSGSGALAGNSSAKERMRRLEEAEGCDVSVGGGGSDEGCDVSVGRGG